MLFDVFLHNWKLTRIEADNEAKAFEKATKLYGLEIDLLEVPCSQNLNNG